MDWVASQDHLNNTGKLRNFDKGTAYIRGQCGNKYLYPDNCKNASNYITDINNEKASYIASSSTANNKSARDTYNDRQKNESWREVYPFNNTDFDYSQYIRNIYNPYSLGIDNMPTMTGLRDNVMKLGNYASAYLEHPTPSDGAKAGISDVNPYNEELLQIKRLTADFPLPYPTFRKDYPEEKYPTTNEYSSSYFLQNGWCPTRITTEAECKLRQYKWSPNLLLTTVPEGYDKVEGVERTTAIIPGQTTTETERLSKVDKPADGACFKPRFAYINNSSKSKTIFKGIIPGMVNDLAEFRPEQLIAPYPNQTLSNLLPCIEDFQVVYPIESGILVIVIIMIIWYYIRCR